MSELTKTRITVRNIFPPFPGKPKGKVSTTDGRDFTAFPDKLALFEQGKEYDIEHDAFTTSSGKVLYGIMKATPANGAAPAPTNGNGYARPGAIPPAGNTGRENRIERQSAQARAIAYLGEDAKTMAWDDFVLVVDKFQLDIDRTPEVPELAFAGVANESGLDL